MASYLAPARDATAARGRRGLAATKPDVLTALAASSLRKAGSEEAVAVIEEAVAVIEEAVAVIADAIAVIEEAVAVIEEAVAVIEETVAVIEEAVAAPEESVAGLARAQPPPASSFSWRTKVTH